jgi:hypothetical protein
MTGLGTFEKVLGEVGQALLPLHRALRSPERFTGLLLKLGWHVDAIPPLFESLGDDLDALFEELQRIVRGGLNVGGAVRLAPDESTVEVSLDDVRRTLHAVRRVVDGVRAIGDAAASAVPAELAADGFLQIFPKQVIDYLVITYLQRYQPKVGFALRAFGVATTTYTAAAGSRPSYIHYRLDIARLPQALIDPSAMLRQAYGWGEANFDAPALLSEVDDLLMSLGVDVLVDAMPTATALAVESSTAPPDNPFRSVLRAMLLSRADATGETTADVRLLALPAAGGHLPGLALLPAFTGSLGRAYEVTHDVTVNVKSDLDLRGGVGLRIRPGEPITVVVGFDGEGNPSTVSGSVTASVERGDAEGPPRVLLGAPDRSRLQYRKLGGTIGVRLDNDGAVDVFAELVLHGLEFVLDGAGADGFLGAVLPDGGLGFGADLTLGVSYRDGCYFRGTAGLELTIPAHVQIGPVEVDSLTVSAYPRDGRLPVSLGATFRIALGPLRAVVENAGLLAEFGFADDHDGNLGPLDVSLGFRPPRGVGLSVRAGVVTGGGFLAVDPDRGQYVGALELTFADFLSLKALGIITTRLPDGARGYSLLALISVEFGAGIQLGFGFTLLAVGGLLGLHRAMRLQSLMEGVRSGALESVMFPRDVVANVPKIVSDLEAFFPERDGTFLIGPMLKLGWGTPTLVSLSVGVIIEVPGDIAVVGVLKVILPSEDTQLIVLQVNFVGAIELDRRRVYCFAALYESRILFMPVEGELGVLAAWGEDAAFVVTAGGFHPRFNPPPLPFPSPRRLAVTLLNLPTARLNATGYAAVTSNSVQFGAQVQAYFGFDELSVNGHLGLDVLFRFSPFCFVVEFSASFSVRVFGTGLFSVRFRGSLEGPDPWHIQGHGSISVLLWDINIRIDVTWGEDRDSGQLPPVPVLPILTTELRRPDNWRAVAPPESRTLVTLRTLPAEEAGRVLHPTGVLQIRQRAVPLDLTLDRVGNQRPSDVNRLRLTAEAASGLAKRADLVERFAPAQFQNYSDAEKLSRPAFVPLHAGIELATAGAQVRSSVLVKRSVRYEEVILDTSFRRRRRRFQDYSGTLFRFQTAGCAAALSPLSMATRAQHQPYADTISTHLETYAVVNAATNRSFTPDSATFASEPAARDFLNAQVAANPALAGTIHVIPSFEVHP